MGLLVEQSWSDLVGRSPTVLLPLGSCEQHGPHLPVDTDLAVAGEVAERAASVLSQQDDVLLAPAQAYAASGEHEGFPGTVSIGQQALELLLIELGRSMLRWAGKLLIVNGHGGNRASVDRAARRLRYEGREAAGWHCRVAGGDAHAGRTETSLISAVRPSSVRWESARAGRVEPLGELAGELVRGGMLAVSSSGVLGDPAGACAREGHAALASMADALCAAFRTWHVVDGILRTAPEEMTL